MFLTISHLGDVNVADCDLLISEVTIYFILLLLFF